MSTTRRGNLSMCDQRFSVAETVATGGRSDGGGGNRTPN
jgi:hypothetical protein